MLRLPTTLLTLALTGCYAAREPVFPPDAFHAPDGGRDAFRLDVATLPDAGLPDSGPPDAFVPDAFASDAWWPELGEDCSLGGAENAFSFTGGGIPVGTRWRETSPDGWVTYVRTVDRIPAPGTGTSQLITIETPGHFSIQTPDAMPFAPGEYRITVLFPFMESELAGVLIAAGGGGSCGRFPGVLTIHEVNVVDGELRRFRASFRQECTDMPLAGCIRYTAP